MEDSMISKRVGDNIVDLHESGVVKGIHTYATENAHKKNFCKIEDKKREKDTTLDSMNFFDTGGTL